MVLWWPMKHSFVESPSHNSALGPVYCGRSDAVPVQGPALDRCSEFHFLPLWNTCSQKLFLLIPYSNLWNINSNFDQCICSITDKCFHDSLELNIIFSTLSPQSIFVHLKKEQSPGRYGSVGWSACCGQKGGGFHFQSGHIPRLQGPSPVRARLGGNQSMFVFHTDAPLSQINKHILTFLKKETNIASAR